jgi:diacylglycerol kinase family enzyme
MSMRPAFIINSSSGARGKEPLVTILEEILGRHGLDGTISIASDGAETIALAKLAVNEKRNPIVAGGGDGTVNAVASQLINTDRVLGLLPLGTLNHFAKDVGVPLELEAAVLTIFHGRVIQVDVGQVNDRIFVNNSSLGLYPQVVHKRDAQRRKLGRGKWPAFILAALSVLRRYPFLDVRLHVGERELIRRSPFVFIGNNHYEMESLNIGARRRLDAGELGIYLANRTGRMGLFVLVWKGLFGGLGTRQDFEVISTKEASIQTRRRKLHVATDGEVTMMKTPLHYRVLPRSLRVLAPNQQ